MKKSHILSFASMLFCITAETQQPDQTQSVAVIVPMRNREHHLQILLERYTAFANKHQNYIDIVVAEQDDQERYNAGKSRNVGFLEATKLNPSHVIFSDADIWPKTDAVWQDMMLSPLPAQFKHFFYGIPRVLGGTFSFRLEDYIKTNGYPNDFIGWGQEDDVFFLRSAKENISQEKYIGGQRGSDNCEFDTDNDHPRDKNIDENRIKLKEWQNNTTGLGDLSYTVTKQVINRLSPFVVKCHIWFK